ncbi:MAG TPA: hypothetical protein VG963_22205, partial [Polyangiaceae bacterium]|nr:hypothetical protein [Polyangiaceae bacterium]
MVDKRSKELVAITNAELPRAAQLPGLGADLEQCSVSGLSSGAFMTVQLHLAHSSMFVGAGIIAGGPYRCAESFRDAAPIAEDANVQTACFVCMSPLTPELGPKPERLAQLARETARDELIDPVRHLAGQRLYMFTGTKDRVVYSSIVAATRRFYELLGVPSAQIRYVSDVPAGHAILTNDIADNPTDANRPPYINRWDSPRMQSWDILEHIYGQLNAPTERLTGRLLRFDQREFLGGSQRSSMSAYGYAYVPRAVEEGARCRVHVVLHGCKQGVSYVNVAAGRPDLANHAPFGDRYVAHTGYNEIADTNQIVILYPQVEGVDDGRVQNP